ncbi:thioesterase II family protein [Streptomyces sp. NPDC020490]|uniref:thioesterase II family protein n=1 Tax=Streptomyces sp. NPDC020490 TaxID=3365078 RepID=UPI00379A0C92
MQVSPPGATAAVPPAAPAAPAAPTAPVAPADAPALLCLPYAGGAAQAFTGLRTALSAAARTELLELPGHGRRMAEPVRDDFGEVLNDLVRSSAPHTTGHYVLLGYSMGAAFAYELARHWSALGRPPSGVVLVGRNGPTARQTFPDIHRLAAPAFLDAVRRLGGTPPQLFERPELIELFAPVLRADFTLSETYEALPGPPLGCPLWVCAGTDDPMVDDAGLRDWENHASGDVCIEWLPGGHFLLDDAAFHAYVGGVLRALPRPRARC